MYNNCLMTLTMTADSWMAMGMTQSPVATAMTASPALMQAAWKRPRWSIGILIETIMEEASAKGLAAMCGYQCGVKGATVVDADALLRDRNADRGFFPLPGASSALTNR